MFQRKGLTTPEQIEEMRQELSQEKQKKRNWFKALRKGCFTIFLIFLVLIFGSIFKLKQAGQIPHIFGYYLFSIESGSMSPTLEVGDIIVSKKPSSTDDLSVGTIVTYYNTDRQIVTHRITDIIVDDSGTIAYQTKGDYEKNTTDLELLTQDRIISVYCFTLRRA